MLDYAYSRNAPPAQPETVRRPVGLTYGSVCSGIEAATVAWEPLGWRPAFFSEIAKFPRAVLSHHYPQVPLHDDFTTIGADDYGPIDLLVGGTPCQSFSLAGLRGGLADDRGNLALEFLRLADRKRPRWLVWENVPGVLSSNGGRDFGSILGGMVKLGYGVAYRVLDAQYFGVPQRRRRVFVVGHLGDWRRAAAVLFERHSLSGHSAPRREARKAVAAGVGESVDSHCPETSPALKARDYKGPSSDGHGDGAPLIVHALRSTQFDPLVFDTTQVTSPANFSNPKPGDPCHPLACRAHPPAIAFTAKDCGADAMDDCCPTLRAGGFTNSHANGGVMPAIAYRTSGNCGAWATGDRSDAITTSTDPCSHVLITSAVRRLTPRECERLMGLPDDYTLVPIRGKPAADAPRYKALGNSMAVPVMRWIGERIHAVERLIAEGTRHD